MGSRHLDELDVTERLFYLLPFIHSEEMQDHLNYLGIKKSWEDHTKVIKKFGRYPYRNKILKRQSTIEEIDFLKGPNSSW